MLFRAAILQGIARGDVTLAFRRWSKPRVRAGGRLRTPAGELLILSVEPSGWPTEADVRAAGYDSVPALTAGLEDGPLWRIAFVRQDDPRVALREAVPDADGIAAVRSALARLRFDAVGYLALVGENPGRRAAELAAEQRLETAVFKRRVRQLKDMGLTESLDVGYRLSPRGVAVLAEERRDDLP